MSLSRTSVSRLTRGLLVASVAAVPVLVMAFAVGLNPVNITVRSSLGGTAAQAVTAK
jgi:hypothetical protein